MSENSTRSPERIPPAAGDIQINFCKNPCCANFGVPASETPQARGRTGGSDTYTVNSSSKTKGSGEEARVRIVPTLTCKLCREVLPMKSNLGVAEERERMLAPHQVPPEPACPDPACSNHTTGVSLRKGRYRLYGRTPSGSRRYLCLGCNKTFSVGASMDRQRFPHKTAEVLSLLVNGMALRRICVVADMTMSTLYGKIDLIHRQLVALAAHYERQLFDGRVQPKKLYLSVDRQDHIINWARRRDKRNTQLHAIGTADNRSGYVFGFHLNFDPDIDRAATEAEAALLGDPEARPPFRRHARLWLPADLPPAIKDKIAEDEALAADARRLPSGLVGEVLRTYREAVVRGDVEAFDLPNNARKLPALGMLVHAEYTIYGHFYFLREMLRHVDEMHISLDQESGIRAACLAAFGDKIRERKCEAFYVRINKELTVNQREQLFAALRRKLDDLRLLYPYDISDTSLRRMLVADALKGRLALGPWRDRWVDVPISLMSEPEKQVCHLTDQGHLTDHEAAELIDRASLHGIDIFFMLVRRLLSPMERPVHSASNTGRVWNQKSLYKVDLAQKLLDIFRIHYNFLKKGEDRQTPAMRLGLINHVVRPGEALNFKANKPDPLPLRRGGHGSMSVCSNATESQ